MSKTEVSKLDAGLKNQLIFSYTALLLHDSKLELTEEKFASVIKASGNKADPKFLKMFPKILNGKDLSQYFCCGGAASSDSNVKTTAAAPKEVKKEGNLNFYTMIIYC